MKSSWYALAACLLLAIPTDVTRADEPLVDAVPSVAGCDADSCVAVPQMGDRGVWRRPVASAVARAGTVPIRLARRLAGWFARECHQLDYAFQGLLRKLTICRTVPRS